MVYKKNFTDEEILRSLCNKYGIKPEIINELLSVEKEYQDHERRRGIFKRIEETIQSSIDE